MLHILLWMLKILGILLAALLAVLLFVFVCVLFVPVRYRIAAEGKLGGEQPVRVGVNVSWLLHIIRVSAFYPKKAGTDAGTGIGIKVRILCFTVFDTAKKKKPGKKQENKNKKIRNKKNKNKKNKNKKNEKRENIIGEEELPSIIEKGANVPESSETMPDAGQKEDTGQECGGFPECMGDGENKEDKPSEPAQGEPEDGENAGQEPESGGVPDGIWKKLKAFYLAWKRLLLRLSAALKNMEYTIRKICGKIRKIADDIQYYTEVLKSETFRGAWEISKKQLLRIGRMLRPKVCRIRLLAGTGDPAGTGQLLAFYGILYPLVGNHVSVDADFDHKVMEGDLLVKGSVTMFVFLLAAFQLFVNKNIRRLLKMLKKEDM